MDQNANRDANLESQPERSGSLLDIAREHPGATAGLLICVVGGAVVGVWGLDAEWSLIRRAAGGGSWLLVMVGRLIG